MSSITFTNISQFIEQPGRQIIRTQAALDKMTTTLLGPYWLADSQRPAKGSPHPNYPMMFAVSSNTENIDGGLSKITMTYAGRTDTTGTGTFMSEVLHSASISEGEVSNNTFFSYISKVILSGTPSNPGQLAIWAAGLKNWATRYASMNGSAKYVTNYPPGGPSQAGAYELWSSTYPMGNSSVTYVTFAGFVGPSPGSLGLTTTSLISSTRPTGWSSNQIIGPWYENTETVSYRLEAIADL